MNASCGYRLSETTCGDRTVTKKERVHRKEYRTREQAKADVFDYVERFYNPYRRHSTIGYVSPVDSKDERKELRVVSRESGCIPPRDATPSTLDGAQD